jgi:uncharacterized membrane protein YgdD (TMEM256/DUF423 family)
MVPDAIGSDGRAEQGSRDMHRVWIGLGSLAGLSAVAVAALVAHGFEWLEPARLQMMRNAVQMHGWHALALLVCGIWAPRGGKLVHCAGATFAAGLPLFCGAVYALVLAGVHVAVMAPVGGMLLMLGWALLGLSALLAR